MFTARDEVDFGDRLAPEDVSEWREGLDKDCPATVWLKVSAPVVLTHVKSDDFWYCGLDGEVVAFSANGYLVVCVSNGVERTVVPVVHSV